MGKAIRLSCAILCFLLCLICCTNVFAITQDEWNRSCRWKTAGTTTVYARTDYQCEGEPIAVLPANTYITAGMFRDAYVTITWYLNGEYGGTGNTKRSNITPASVTYRTEDGSISDMHELDWKALYGSLPPNNMAVTPVDSNSTGSSGNTGSTGNTQSSGTAKKAGTSKRRTPAKPAATPEPTPEVMWKESPITVQRLGIANSIVTLDGDTKDVATAELIFAADQAEEKHVAVIYAPNTGKCTLRSSGSDSGAALMQCKAGTVVSVLKYGSQYTRIGYNGSAGYVLTSCLKFYGTEAQATGVGTIIYSKDKPNVKTTINIRNKTDKGSAKVAEWSTGTEVQVFSHPKGWYEVEYNGIHGYVMEQFLQIPE